MLTILESRRAGSSLRSIPQQPFHAYFASHAAPAHIKDIDDLRRIAQQTVVAVCVSIRDDHDPEPEQPFEVFIGPAAAGHATHAGEVQRAMEEAYLAWQRGRDPRTLIRQMRRASVRLVVRIRAAMRATFVAGIVSSRRSILRHRPGPRRRRCRTNRSPRSPGDNGDPDPPDLVRVYPAPPPDLPGSA